MSEQPISRAGAIPLFLSCFIPSAKLLKRNDPLRMAGATAFFTTFALPPIIFLLAQLFGLFFTSRMVGRGLIETLSNSLGADGAEQVRQVIRSIRGFHDSWYVVVFGFLFLFFVATTLFIVIKNSFRQLWQLSVPDKSSFASGIGSRLRSFAVIVLAGILFFANLLFKSAETFGGNFIEELFNGGSIYFKLIFGEVTSIIIVSAWFIILFRFLTDARPAWKAVIAGGILTAVLFTLGRFVLRSLLVDGNIGQLYGASGSFVLVLLFVFYTSFILYFGAGFVKIYGDKRGWPVREKNLRN